MWTPFIKRLIKKAMISLWISVPVSLCSTFTFKNFLSPKKKVLFQKKFKRNFKKENQNKFIMQLFSARYSVFKEIKKEFWTLKTWKNWPKKLLIIGPQLFLCTGPAARTAQKQKSCTNKSPLMHDWIFGLGVQCTFQMTNVIFE